MEQKKRVKPVRIGNDLIIAAMAYRCPFRTDTNPIYASCDGEHPTNCNPRLCSRCTQILDDMAMIAEQGIDNFI